jgi:hypothetical protein
LLDLADVHIKLLGQFHQRLLTSDSGATFALKPGYGSGAASFMPPPVRGI